MASRNRCKFADQEIFLEGFVVAGSPAAHELLGPRGAESPHCVNCGAPLEYVFATSVGPMGGDCLATCTGEPSTRAVFRKLVKKIPWSRECGKAVEVRVKRSARDYGVIAEVITDRSYVDEWSGRWCNLKTFYFGFAKERELPVALAAAAQIAGELSVPLSVDEDVPGAEAFGP